MNTENATVHVHRNRKVYKNSVFLALKHILFVLKLQQNKKELKNKRKIIVKFRLGL